MIPTLPEKYKCKEFAEKKEIKRSGQVIPFKFIFFVRNKVRLYDRNWVQEKQISRWIYEMHDLYRKSWRRRSWHLMGLNFCKANFCFISSAVVSVWVHYLKSPPKKEGKNTRNIWIMTSKHKLNSFARNFYFWVISWFLFYQWLLRTKVSSFQIPSKERWKNTWNVRIMTSKIQNQWLLWT